MGAPTPDLVIFDVCDTLYAENTTVGFLRHFHRDRAGSRYKRLEWLVTSKASPAFYVGAVAQRLFQRDVARAWLVRSLAGAREAELREAADHYAKQLDSRANRALHERLAEHRAQGHRIVLVSSSLDLVIAAIARRLGAEWRASRLGLEGGRCTGRLVTDLTGRKHEEVAALAAEAGPGTRLHVYTDNLSDLDLVSRAEHAHVVIPAGRSRAGWGGVDAAFIEL
jgi:HAD superfamily hydrolase (TIGR01490 family)